MMPAASRCFLKQLDGCQHILLVGLNDCAIHQHFIQNVMCLSPEEHSICCFRLKGQDTSAFRIVCNLCSTLTGFEDLRPELQSLVTDAKRNASKAGHDRKSADEHLTISILNMRSSSQTLLKNLSNVSTRQWINSRIASSFCKVVQYSKSISSLQESKRLCSVPQLCQSPMKKLEGVLA
jgi:hypothetical protein